MSRPFFPFGFLLLAAGLCYGVVFTSETFWSDEQAAHLTRAEIWLLLY